MSKTEKEYFGFNLTELIDLMSNVQIKETKFSEKKYTEELIRLSKDIDIILNKKKIKISAKILRKIIFVSISNLLVWEFKDLMLEKKNHYDKILKKALQLNSIRNTTTNSLMRDFNEYQLSKKRITDFTKKDVKWVNYLKKKLNDK